MKLEQQVCSLEQAKKLKELGVNQQFSLFTHVDNDIRAIQYEGIKLSEQTSSFKIDGVIEDGGVIRYYSAFTVAELGVMLHNYNSTYLPILDSKFKTEAEYRADRLIACIPELITVEEVNARLTA